MHFPILAFEGWANVLTESACLLDGNLTRHIVSIMHSVHFPALAFEDRANVLSENTRLVHPRPDGAQPLCK